jgi:hypothetical protein
MQAQSCSPVDYTMERLKNLFACRTIAFVGDSLVRNLGEELVRKLGARQMLQPSWQISWRDDHKVTTPHHTNVHHFFQTHVRSPG